MTGMPRVCATPRLAESTVCTRQQRRYPQIAEIAPPFVCGEARVKRHTDRSRLRPPMIATAASGPSGNTTATRSLRPTPRLRKPRTTSFVRPQRAPYVRRGVSGRQHGIAVRRRSPIEGKKIFETRKDAAYRLASRRSSPRFVAGLRQGRLFSSGGRIILDFEGDVSGRASPVLFGIGCGLVIRGDPSTGPTRVILQVIIDRGGGIDCHFARRRFFACLLEPHLAREGAAARSALLRCG